MKLRFIIAIAIVCMPLCSFNILSNQSESGNLHIEVTGLKNLKGQVGILIFDNEDGFPMDHGKSIKNVLVPIGGDMVKYTFENIPFGEYAVAVMHDENMNDKLDTNFLGIPKEGTGVSNNVRSSLRAPKFSESKFNLTGENITTTINLNY